MPIEYSVSLSYRHLDAARRFVEGFVEVLATELELLVPERVFIDVKEFDKRQADFERFPEAIEDALRQALIGR